MYFYMVLELTSWLMALVAIFYIILKLGFFAWLKKKIKKTDKKIWIGVGVLLFSLVLWTLATKPYPLNFAMPPHMRSAAPGNKPPSIPIPTAAEFLLNTGDFEFVDDIGADPNAVPDPITRDYSETVRFDIETKEVIGEVADGVSFNYWTYNGQAPGPMMRVREGDTVIMSLTNHESSLHPHNIDLHAVTGPGGGGKVTKVEPGETKTFKWKALQPGLYVYHCATSNISTHNAHGQYGLIMVDPKDPLPEVDKEFYIVQGELYTAGGIGKKGLTVFDSQALLDEEPTYITFNGKVESSPRMKAEVGDTVRMYVGNGGVGLVSSFHVIGEIFDTVYPEAAIGSEPNRNIQTTAVLPGGATIVEFKLDVPGEYVLVDHALARMNKGAWAILEVEGEPDPEVFEAL